MSGVTVRRGTTTLLRDIDWTVELDERWVVLGPNGAGKTTLLRVASGLLRPSAGHLLVDGQDATGWASHQLAGAGVCHVPEGRGIFRALSVRDNIRLQTNPAVDVDPIRAVSEAFPRLGERLDQRAGTMSGGEQQMLALARSYLAGSKTVLLDEVSMGLAPKIIDEIFEYLRRLAAQGAALLLVEQYVGRALELADFVYILNKGRVQFVGESDELGEEQILASYLGVEA